AISFQLEVSNPPSFLTEPLKSSQRASSSPEFPMADHSTPARCRLSHRTSNDSDPAYPASSAASVLLSPHRAQEFQGRVFWDVDFDLPYIVPQLPSLTLKHVLDSEYVADHKHWKGLKR